MQKSRGTVCVGQPLPNSMKTKSILKKNQIKSADNEVKTKRVRFKEEPLVHVSSQKMKKIKHTLPMRRSREAAKHSYKHSRRVHNIKHKNKAKKIAFHHRHMTYYRRSALYHRVRKNVRNLPRASIAEQWLSEFKRGYSAKAAVVSGHQQTRERTPKMTSKKKLARKHAAHGMILRSREQWNKNYHRMKQNANEVDCALQQIQKKYLEPPNTLRTDTGKMMRQRGFTRYIQFENGQEMISKGIRIFPLAMTPIERGKNSTDLVGKGDRCPFFTNVIWHSCKGIHKENACLLFKQFEASLGIVNRMQLAFTNKEMTTIQNMQTLFDKPVDWKKV